MFVFIGNEFVKICKTQHNEVKMAQEHIQAMKEAIIKYGYDGEWFLRAYDDFGNKVGGRRTTSQNIHRNAGFCVMAGIGTDDGKAEKALDSAWKYLGTEQWHGFALPGI